MSDETYNRSSVQMHLIQLTLHKMQEIFGNEIANPIQEPIRFNHQVQVANFTLKRIGKEINNG